MVYCFDLDGTLCTNTNGEYIYAKPLSERISVVNKLYDNGNSIIIDTARGSTTKIDWLLLTKKQLSLWGIKYHELRVGVKLYADVYIDDKGLSDVDFFNK
jgi:hypothetical protein